MYLPTGSNVSGLGVDGTGVVITTVEGYYTFGFSFLEPAVKVNTVVAFLNKVKIYPDFLKVVACLKRLT